MKIIIPNRWRELNDYQQRELVSTINSPQDMDATERYIRIVQILLMKNSGITAYLKMRKILNNIPLSAFQNIVKFVSEKPDIYSFPKIKNLTEPAPRLGDFTIEQFSLCDLLYHRYHKNKDEKYLRQLIATLYRFKSPNSKAVFDKQLLPKIALITDKIPLKEAERIAFIFFSVKIYIADAYPSIFKQKPKSDDMPVFGDKDRYTPFSQIIVMMSADELRLLGNLNECKKTLLYDFLSAFIESKKIHRIKSQLIKSS